MSLGPLLCSPQCPTGLFRETPQSVETRFPRTRPLSHACLQPWLADVTAVLFVKFVNLEMGLFLPPPNPTTSCRTPLSPGP